MERVDEILTMGAGLIVFFILCLLLQLSDKFEIILLVMSECPASPGDTFLRPKEAIVSREPGWEGPIYL